MSSSTCSFRCKHCHQQFSQNAVYQEATVIQCPLCSKMFMPSFWHYLRKEWIEPISVAIVLALFIKRIIFEIYVIPTSSMEPTLHGNGHHPEDGGDKVLVNKFVYHFTDPTNWDVIVFDPPEGNHLFIKRLIGLPNQVIQIVDGDIYKDGKILRKPPEVEDALLYPIYDSSKVKNHLDHFVDFQKPAWSISENWRIADNHFSINKAKGKLKFELPIDMRIASHMPNKMQIDSGLYEEITRGGRTDWHKHEDYVFQNLKVGDIQVKGKLQVSELTGVLQLVITENEDKFILAFHIKDGKAEVLRNKDKVWESPIAFTIKNEIEFSFSNVDDKLSGKIGSAIFDYSYVNEKFDSETTKNGFEFQANDCSLEMKDIVVRRDVNYLSVNDGSYYTMEKIPGHASESLFATFRPGPNEFLCFGDNVMDSRDSRYWGFAKGDKIKGKAMFVLMPIRIWPGDDLPPKIPFLTNSTRFKTIH